MEKLTIKDILYFKNKKQLTEVAVFNQIDALACEKAEIDMMQIMWEEPQMMLMPWAQEMLYLWLEKKNLIEKMKGQGLKQLKSKFYESGCKVLDLYDFINS